jgi:hypothetical protein
MELAPERRRRWHAGQVAEAVLVEEPDAAGRGLVGLARTPQDGIGRRRALDDERGGVRELVGDRRAQSLGDRPRVPRIERREAPGEHHRLARERTSSRRSAGARGAHGRSL